MFQQPTTDLCKDLRRLAVKSLGIRFKGPRLSSDKGRLLVMLGLSMHHDKRQSKLIGGEYVVV